MPDHGDPPPLTDRGRVDALTTAAVELDLATTTVIVNEMLRAHGMISTWTDLLAPALRRRGEQFDRTANGIAAEHLLSERTRATLSVVIWRRRRWNCCAPVLLGAPDGEQHALPLLALAAALAEVHQPTVLLDASVPPRALLDAATQLEPKVIFLVAGSRHGTPCRAAPPPGPRPVGLVVGGPGRDRDAPGRVGDLAAAVRAYTQLLRPLRHGAGVRPDLAS